MDCTQKYRCRTNFLKENSSFLIDSDSPPQTAHFILLHLASNSNSKKVIVHFIKIITLMHYFLPLLYVKYVTYGAFSRTTFAMLLNITVLMSDNSITHSKHSHSQKIQSFTTSISLQIPLASQTWAWGGFEGINPPPPKDLHPSGQNWLGEYSNFFPRNKKLFGETGNLFFCSFWELGGI